MDYLSCIYMPHICKLPASTKPFLQDEVHIRNLCATEPDDFHQDLDDYFDDQ